MRRDFRGSGWFDEEAACSEEEGEDSLDSRVTLRGCVCCVVWRRRRWKSWVKEIGRETVYSYRCQLRRKKERDE